LQHDDNNCALPTVHYECNETNQIEKKNRFRGANRIESIFGESDSANARRNPALMELHRGASSLLSHSLEDCSARATLLRPAAFVVHQHPPRCNLCRDVTQQPSTPPLPLLT